MSLEAAEIRSSFVKFKRHACVAGLTFYRQLFGMDPSLRRLFHHNIEDQSVNLMEMLGTAVGLLDQQGVLQRVLLALGRRHAGYGVEDRHYDAVGRALLETLAECLGADFTHEARNAWAALYAYIAKTMQRGAAVTAASSPDFHSPPLPLISPCNFTRIHSTKNEHTTPANSTTQKHEHS